MPRVLRQAPVAHLRIAGGASPGSGAPPSPESTLCASQSFLGTRLVEPPAPARPHGHLPVHFPTLVLRTLVHALVAGVAPHLGFAAVTKCACVTSAPFGNPWVRPDCESTPMCAFIPKYQRLPFFVGCISGSRSPFLFFVDEGASIEARVHDRARLEPVTLQRQVRVDLPEQPLPQTVTLQQMPKVQDRRLVRQRARPPQPRKATHRLHLYNRSSIPGSLTLEQLHAVNSKHRSQGSAADPVPPSDKTARCAAPAAPRESAGFARMLRVLQIVLQKTLFHQHPHRKNSAIIPGLVWLSTRLLTWRARFDSSGADHNFPLLGLVVEHRTLNPETGVRISKGGPD